MDREIKFRVWDKVNKKWIDDSDIAINQQGLLFIRYEGQVAFDSISLTKSKTYEISLHTGLKNKNGKEIYEGDIVKFGNRKTEVRYIAGSFKVEQVDYREFMEGNKHKAWVNLDVENNNIETIGNIYENPELLKTAKGK